MKTLKTFVDFQKQLFKDGLEHWYIGDFRKNKEGIGFVVVADPTAEKCGLYRLEKEAVHRAESLGVKFKEL